MKTRMWMVVLVLALVAVTLVAARSVSDAQDSVEKMESMMARCETMMDDGGMMMSGMSQAEHESHHAQ